MARQAQLEFNHPVSCNEYDKIRNDSMNTKNLPTRGVDVNDLEQQAQSLVNSGQYKKAIVHYKQLLQTAKKDEWQQKLAHCYLQRALTFADKGMIKEAIVLWENFQQHSAPPYNALDRYICWLIQTRKEARLEASLSQLSVQQIDKEFPALAALLGFLILSQSPQYRQFIPENTVFSTHLEIAFSALQAFKDRNPGLAGEILKKLPYRSAFKDFRTLLSAVISLPHAIDKTHSLLNRIAAESPYSGVARSVRCLTLKGREQTKALLSLPEKQQQRMTILLGLNTDQLQLLKQLNGQKTPLTDKKQFELAIKFHSLWGKKLAQQFCHAKLAAYPAGWKVFNKHFGTISEFERHRLNALACEKQDRHEEADFYWQQAIRALPTQAPDHGLKTALILRHIGRKFDPDQQIPVLIDSLEYDPNDRDTHLQILDYYKNQKPTTDYRKWLKTSLNKFPQDIDILSLAVQDAVTNKANDKAIEYAQNLLKSDPLNAFAKQTLFSSHLTAARTLIRSKQFDRVSAEIERAENTQVNKSMLLQAQLTRSFFCFASLDKQHGLDKITTTLMKMSPDPLNRHFLAAMEALTTGLPVATILRALPDISHHVLSGEGLEHLIRLIKHYHQNNIDQQLIHKGLAKIKAPLKQSLQQHSYRESQLLAMCQTLDQIGHFELLRFISKSMHPHPITPIWGYYQTYSTTNGDPSRCTSIQYLKLQANLEKAIMHQDARANVLIQNYLDRYHELHPPENQNVFDQLFDFAKEEEFFDDPLDILFGHLPDKILDKIDNKLESIAKKLSPEKLVSKTCGDQIKHSRVINAMMKNPDLFTALLILQAAKELKLHTDVGIENVLDVFDVKKNDHAAPCPF